MPAMLMVRPVKVATPLTAVTVTVPPSMAPLVPPDRASVTEPCVGRGDVARAVLGSDGEAEGGVRGDAGGGLS